MDKRILRTVTITIIETWTITWAEGAAQTAVFRARQPGQLLPARPNEPQGWAEIETIGANSSPCAPIAQTRSSETMDGTG